MQFANVAAEARLIADLITNAEIRLAAALAIVEGEPPPDDGGKEVAA
jgi:hypothetical protein